jgi:malonyl-CoA decarboxylase
MKPTRPSAVQLAALRGQPSQTRSNAKTGTPRGLVSTLRSYLMDAPSFLKRFIGSVVPSDRRRSHRRARQAMELFQALLSERGEVSGAALARDALAAYNALPKSALPAFFDALSDEFAPDRTELELAYTAYHDNPTQENLIRLQRCVEAPRQELFRRLNTAPGGTAALVAMRREVLTALDMHAEWKGIDSDLEHLFGSWFNRGFLTLERIDWYTPAVVLEKLIEYEAVHEIQGWDDLRRRLAADRRCFAFFHPALPHEPLIFIEVAFTRGLSGSIDALIGPDAHEIEPESADTAIFYSITNCQTGLRGISFGNLLIKQVAQRLGQEFPKIRTFATLSPIPGLRAWLRGIGATLKDLPGGAAHFDVLARIESPAWHKDEAEAERVRKVLMPYAAYYLAYAKHGTEAADPVARFHLGNGARLERLNWLADTGKRGLQQSAGLMVNYLYRLDEVESNHEAYVHSRQVAMSRDIRRLAADCPLSQVEATAQ